MFSVRFTPTRKAALDAVIDREEAKGKTLGEHQWQEAVRKVTAIEAELSAALPALEREEADARDEVRVAEAALQKARNKYGYHRRRQDAVRFDYSQQRGRAMSEAERLAPKVISDLWREVADATEAFSKRPINQWNVDTGRLDKRGRPIIERRSDYPERAEKLHKLVALRDRVQAMKLEVVPDLPAALAKVREEIKQLTAEP